MPRLKEPSAAIIDAFLFIFSAVISTYLFVRCSGEPGVEARAYLFWCALFFFSNAITALIGVLDHGFATGTPLEAILEKCHASFLGLSGFIFVLLSMLLVGGLAFAWDFLYLPLIAFLLFEAVILIRYSYLYFVIYAIIMFVGALFLTAVALRGGVPTEFVIMGIAMLLIGALFHFFKVTLGSLSHNDLYHFSFVCSYSALLVGILAVSRHLAAM
jgi:hypothetical protein